MWKLEASWFYRAPAIKNCWLKSWRCSTRKTTQRCQAKHISTMSLTRTLTIWKTLHCWQTTTAWILSNCRGSASLPPDCVGTWQSKVSLSGIQVKHRHMTKVIAIWNCQDHYRANMFLLKWRDTISAWSLLTMRCARILFLTRHGANDCHNFQSSRSGQCTKLWKLTSLHMRPLQSSSVYAPVPQNPKTPFYFKKV